MDAPRLIYSSTTNARTVEIALRTGFELGARLPRPGTIADVLAFADQEWHRPDRVRYMRELDRYRPDMATVLDWEPTVGLDLVLDWAAEAAQYVRDYVIIIPKVPGRVGEVPGQVAGKRVVLGYSVPSAYAGTPCDIGEFAGRDVHLLGGGPSKQFRIYRWATGRAGLPLHGACRIVSVDMNAPEKAAKRFAFWSEGRWQSAPGSFASMYDALELSLTNIRAQWTKECSQ